MSICDFIFVMCFLLVSAAAVILALRCSKLEDRIFDQNRTIRYLMYGSHLDIKRAHRDGNRR